MSVIMAIAVASCLVSFNCDANGVGFMSGVYSDPLLYIERSNCSFLFRGGGGGGGEGGGLTVTCKFLFKDDFEKSGVGSSSGTAVYT